MLDLALEPAAYAEDQPYSHTILGTHVLHRGFNSGAMLGVFSSLGIDAYRRVTTPKHLYHFSAPHLIKYASRGGYGGLAFGAVFLAAVMYDKSTIEWQDRSWRLLQNPTQNQTDHWSVAGTAAGLAAAAAAVSSGKIVGPGKWMAGAAIGSTAAVVLMMASRAVLGEPGKMADEQQLLATSTQGKRLV